jgi:environmental stress-induced protein Ves
MRLLKAADYVSMKWKNGAGGTTQIAIHPAAATTENFSWRISMAAVTTDGPFSEFPETERTLVVLQGAGIELALSDGKSDGNAERLTNGSEPFTFAADRPAHAKLINGPILDLNVMTRRDRFTHLVRKFSGPAAWEASTGTVVLFSPAAGLQIDADAKTINLASGDTLIFDNGAGALRVIPEYPGNYYLMEFNRL